MYVLQLRMQNIQGHVFMIYGRFAPKTFRPLPGRFASWTFRPLDDSPSGRFALWTIRPLHVDVSLPGRFAPYTWTFRPLNFRSWVFPPLDLDVQMDVAYACSVKS